MAKDIIKKTPIIHKFIEKHRNIKRPPPISIKEFICKKEEKLQKILHRKDAQCSSPLSPYKKVDDLADKFDKKWEDFSPS